MNEGSDAGDYTSWPKVGSGQLVKIVLVIKV